jgi:GGDEF domain-containing protein
MLKPAVSPVDPVALPLSTLPDVIESVLDVVAQLLGVRLAVVGRIESTTYTVMAVVDQLHAIRPGHIWRLSDTFCMSMLEGGHALHLPDTQQATLPLRAAPNLMELNVRSYVGVPLTMADGRVFGSLWAADTDPRPFTADDVALLQLFARLLTHEIDQDARYRHLERIKQVMATQTNIDPLTGLMGAAGFDTALTRESARRSRYNNQYAVAVLEIERCDADTDHMLEARRQALADILMRSSRLVDCCARIDEATFAVLFPETSADGVAAWRERIETAVAMWNRVHAVGELAMRVSIGVADCHDVPNWRGRGDALLDVARSRVGSVIAAPANA